MQAPGRPVLSGNTAEPVRAPIGHSAAADDRIADARSRRAGRPVARIVDAHPCYEMASVLRPELTASGWR